jgi:DNA replication protein DnaC
VSDPQPIEAAFPGIRRQLVRGTNKEPAPVNPLTAVARQAGLRQVLDATWLQVIPSKFVASSWDGFSDTEARDRLRAWTAAKEGTNLVVVGPWGTGKTSGAVVALRAAHDAGFEIRFVDVRDLISSLYPDSLYPGGSAGAMADAIECDRLLIDDVGHEVKTPRSVEWVDHIISARYNEQRPTVVTSNLNLTDLEAHLGGHAASRLLGDGATIVTMRGTDRRRGK